MTEGTNKTSEKAMPGKDKLVKVGYLSKLDPLLIPTSTRAGTERTGDLRNVAARAQAAERIGSACFPGC